jgi:hypothetical protein
MIMLVLPGEPSFASDVPRATVRIDWAGERAGCENRSLGLQNLHARR